MKIRIETIETAAGPMHDLVLVKGANTVRLKLTCLSPELAAAQLGQWIEDNTMYVAEIVRSEATTVRVGVKGAKVPA